MARRERQATSVWLVEPSLPAGNCPPPLSWTSGKSVSSVAVAVGLVTRQLLIPEGLGTPTSLLTDQPRPPPPPPSPGPRLRPLPPVRRRLPWTCPPHREGASRRGPRPKREGSADCRSSRQNMAKRPASPVTPRSLGAKARVTRSGLTGVGLCWGRRQSG